MNASFGSFTTTELTTADLRSKYHHHDFIALEIVETFLPLSSLSSSSNSNWDQCEALLPFHHTTTDPTTYYCFIENITLKCNYLKNEQHQVQSRLCITDSRQATSSRFTCHVEFLCRLEHLELPRKNCYMNLSVYFQRDILNVLSLLFWVPSSLPKFYKRDWKIGYY